MTVHHPTRMKLLMALAARLQRHESFDKSGVIVAAWRAYPAEFGLARFEDTYPDSNKVLTKLYGSTGLIWRGFIEQVDQTSFGVTAAGYAEAARRQAMRPGPSLAHALPRPPALPREFMRGAPPGAPAAPPPDPAQAAELPADPEPPRARPGHAERCLAWTRPDGGRCELPSGHTGDHVRYPEERPHRIELSADKRTAVLHAPKTVLEVFADGAAAEAAKERKHLYPFMRQVERPLGPVYEGDDED